MIFCPQCQRELDYSDFTDLKCSYCDFILINKLDATTIWLPIIHFSRGVV